MMIFGHLRDLHFVHFPVILLGKSFEFWNVDLWKNVLAGYGRVFGLRMLIKRHVTGYQYELRVVSTWHLVDRLSRFIDTANTTVIRTYEDKITKLECWKIILGEQLAAQAEPKASNEEKLEPVLTFLASL